MPPLYQLVFRAVGVALELMLDPIIARLRRHQRARPVGRWLARHRRTFRVVLIVALAIAEPLLLGLLM